MGVAMLAQVDTGTASAAPDGDATPAPTSSQSTTADIPSTKVAHGRRSTQRRSGILAPVSPARTPETNTGTVSLIVTDAENVETVRLPVGRRGARLDRDAVPETSAPNMDFWTAGLRTAKGLADWGANETRTPSASTTPTLSGSTVQLNSLTSAADVVASGAFQAEVSTEARTASSISTPANSGALGAIAKVARWVGAFLGFPGVPALPGQPTLAGLALLVRRQFEELLFNREPTAAPITLVETNNGQLFGTLGAHDLEGDPISYTISQPPQHGSVSVDEDGVYTYTPGDGFSGADSFIVTLKDSGFHVNLANLFGSSGTTVTVDVVIPKATTFDTTYHIANLTSHRLKLTDVDLASDNSSFKGAEVGTIIEPGLAMDVQATNKAFILWTKMDLDVSLKLESVDAAGQIDGLEIYELILNPNGRQNEGVPGFSSCKATNGGQCNTTSGVKLDWNAKASADLKDAPGTAIAVPAAEIQKQTDLLNAQCDGSKSAFSCSFDEKTTEKQYTDDEGYIRYLLGAEVPVGQAISNASSSPITQDVSIDATYRSEISIDTNTNASLHLLNIVSAEVSEKYGVSVSTIYNYTWRRSIEIGAKKEVFFTSRPAIYRITGDVIVKLGNTTWTLQDVVFSTPNPTEGSGELYVHERDAPKLPI
jgi:hypothetical protein